MREYKLADLYAGMEESFTAGITREMEDAFRIITGDLNPLHSDDDFAASVLEGAKGHAVFGMLTASLLSTLAGMYLPGKYSLIHSVEGLSFLKPVYAGDVLTVKGTVTEVYTELRMIRLKVSITRGWEESPFGGEETVCKAKMKVLVLK